MKESSIPGPAAGADAAAGERLPRRRFLVHLGVSVAAAGVALGCESSSGEDAEEATGPVPAGNVNGVPVGYLNFVGGKPVVLGRDAGGLYAMSAICTHQRCNMSETGSVSSAGVACSCHGSRYSPVGAVTSGPAPAPLKHYLVDLAADGTITVQASTVVAQDARTPVMV
jgi:Rieske Fe-S protein